MNQQLTFNVITDRGSQCRQPLQHGVRDRVGLDSFCGIETKESNRDRFLVIKENKRTDYLAQIA